MMLPQLSSTVTLSNAAVTAESIRRSALVRYQLPSVSVFSRSSPAARPRMTTALSLFAAASFAVFSSRGISS